MPARYVKTSQMWVGVFLTIHPFSHTLSHTRPTLIHALTITLHACMHARTTVAQKKQTFVLHLVVRIQVLIEDAKINPPHPIENSTPFVRSFEPTLACRVLLNGKKLFV